MAILGIERSTLAGGLGGILTWGVGLGLAHFGVVIPPEVLSPLIIGVMTLLIHYVPDAAKVDATIKDAAKYIPTAEPDYSVKPKS